MSSYFSAFSNRIQSYTYNLSEFVACIAFMIPASWVFLLVQDAVTHVTMTVISLVLQFVNANC